VTLIEGILGSIIAAGIVAMIVASYRRWFGQEIRITSPLDGGTLTDPEPLGSGLSFPVRGVLRFLPKNHEIWLLVQSLSGKTWPQGFHQVDYNHRDGTWRGRITGMGRERIRIIAVIAPPTSQDYFRYFQKLGDECESGFPPILRVPVECKKRHSVEANVPPPTAPRP